MVQCLSLYIHHTHPGALHDINISANGNWLASCGEDKAVKIYDIMSFGKMADVINLRLNTSLNCFYSLLG
mgnify:CR=1 FL=1